MAFLSHSLSFSFKKRENKSPGIFERRQFRRKSEANKFTRFMLLCTDSVVPVMFCKIIFGADNFFLFRFLLNECESECSKREADSLADFSCFSTQIK